MRRAAQITWISWIIWKQENMLNANAFCKNIDTHFLLSSGLMRARAFSFIHRHIFIFHLSVSNKSSMHPWISYSPCACAHHKIHWILSLDYNIAFYLYYIFIFLFLFVGILWPRQELSRASTATFCGRRCRRCRERSFPFQFTRIHPAQSNGILELCADLCHSHVIKKLFSDSRVCVRWPRAVPLLDCALNLPLAQCDQCESECGLLAFWSSLRFDWAEWFTFSRRQLCLCTLADLRVSTKAPHNNPIVSHHLQNSASLMTLLLLSAHSGCSPFKA